MRIPRFQVELDEGDIRFVWLEHVDQGLWRLVYWRVINKYVRQVCSQAINGKINSDAHAFLESLVQSGQIMWMPDGWVFTKYADPENVNFKGLVPGVMVEVTYRDMVPMTGIFLGWKDAFYCHVYMNGVPTEVDATLVNVDLRGKL